MLFAVHGYKPAYRVGGPILSVSAVAESLVGRGHKVTVFTSNANLDQDLDVPVDQPLNVNGVEVWYFRRQEYLQRWVPFIPYFARSSGFLYAPAMRAELDRIVPRVDVVHTHMPYVYPTFAAGRAALRHRKPLIYHQRGVFDPERLRFRGLKKRLYIHVAERPLMRRASQLIALTDAEVLSYRALGVDTSCRVIPNGIDPTVYRTAPSVDAAARWGIPAGSLVVLFLGRVHPIKGAERLLRAFLAIQAHHPTAYLVLAGPDEWGLEKAFRHQVIQANAQGRVLFPGMVFGDDKLDLLARADLFCLPSDAEGFSMAVLEALASSTAVLLSPGCHFPQVEAAGAGRVVSTDPRRMAAVMSELLADPLRLRSMGARGREMVRTEYSWDRVTDQLEEVYREAVSLMGVRNS